MRMLLLNSLQVNEESGPVEVTSVPPLYFYIMKEIITGFIYQNMVIFFQRKLDYYFIVDTNITTLLFMSTITGPSFAGAFKKTIRHSRAISDTINVPESFRVINTYASVRTEPFSKMVTSLINKISCDVKATRDLKGICGENWPYYITAACLNEILQVAEFIEFSRLVPRVSMSNYTSFLKPEITVGCSRYLYIEASYPELLFSNYADGSLTLRRSVNLTSEQVLLLADTMGVARTDLTSIDVSKGPNFPLIYNTVLSAIKYHFPDFDYKVRDLYLPLYREFPDGDFQVISNGDGTEDCMLLDTVSDSYPNPNNVAYNLLFNMQVGGDFIIYGNSLYETFSSQKINYPQYQSSLLLVWTGIKGVGHFTSDVHLSPIAQPIDPNPIGPLSSQPPRSSGPNPGSRRGRNMRPNFDRPSVSVSDFVGDVIRTSSDFVSSTVTPELLQKLALRFYDAYTNKVPQINIEHYPESFVEGYEFATPSVGKWGVFKHSNPKITRGK